MNPTDRLGPESRRPRWETELFAELARLLAADWPFFERQFEALAAGHGSQKPLSLSQDHLMYEGVHLIRLVGKRPSRIVLCALLPEINDMIASKLLRHGWEHRLLPAAVAFEYSCDAMTTIHAEYVYAPASV